jgi:hypothetical protein
MKISVVEAKETARVMNHLEDLSSKNLGRVAWSDDLNNPIAEGCSMTTEFCCECFEGMCVEGTKGAKLDEKSGSYGILIG